MGLLHLFTGMGGTAQPRLEAVCSLPGLRMFLSGNAHTIQFMLEMPVHLPQETKTMEVYNDKEIAALESLLSSGILTKRDIAVCRLLLETCLRGSDVCPLMLKDLDWEKHIVSTIQNKTKRQLILPLKASYGNAIANYILNKRPKVTLIMFF